MNFKRIGRILVCLMLICALVINISPIKAEAVVVELTAAQLLKWGVVAMVTLMTCGVFFQIQNELELQDLGRTYYNHAHAAASAAERLDDLDAINDVIGEAVDNKVIPFGGSGALPGSFWKSLLSIATISLLDVFLKHADGYFEAHYPSSGTLANGDTLVHNGVTYTITSASAPVFFFTQCSVNSCQTVVCSSEKFTWSRDVSYSISLKQPVSMTIDGVYMYCQNDTLSNSGFGTSCYPCDSKWGVTALRSRAAGIVGTGSPTYNISPSLIEGDLQEDYELVGDTHALEIPDIDFSSMSSTQDIIDTANKIIDGEMTYEDLINKFSSGVAPSVVPLPEVNPSPDPEPDTGGDTATDPDDESAELTWWQRFTKWFQELRTSINELPNRFDKHFENVNNNIEEVPSKFEAWINGVQTSVDAVAESILGTADEINAAIQGLPDTFLSHASMIMEAIGAVPQAVVVGLRSALEALFVPDPDFIPNKVQALQAQYEWLEPMKQTGEDLKLFFQNIGSQPPIIWIDLGAGTGWYPMGGKVKFIDLTWYSQYKPTADFIVGGSIWLWLAWRMFKGIPGIISGDSGYIGAPTVSPDIPFNTARLPAGRGRRKKDGE